MRKRDYPVIREKRAALGLPEDSRNALEGLPVIMTGWAAEEGTALLAAEHEKELTERFHPDTVSEAMRILSKPFTVPEMPVCVWPLSKGGILAGLWKLTEELDCGIRVDLKAVPLRQESIEICEYFGIDPYALLSGGAYLAVAVREQHILAALRASGVKAAVIGRLASDKNCLLTCGERSRFLSRPEEDSMETAGKQQTGEIGHAD